MSTTADTAQLRLWVYHLIIGIAFAIACGRIVSVQRVYEPAFHRDPAKQGDRRPMADHPEAMAELRRLLAIREPLYAQAAATVDTSRLGVKGAADAVTRLVRRHAAAG